jgi:hypothetical protein
MMRWNWFNAFAASVAAKAAKKRREPRGHREPSGQPGPGDELQPEEACANLCSYKPASSVFLEAFSIRFAATPSHSST